MALISQQDVPVAGANGYGTVAGFRAYHLDRGRTFTEADGVVETWLIQATDYVDTRFRYKGWRETDTQTTEFPREDLYDDRGDQVRGIPQAVEYATYEYAARVRTAALMPDPTLDASGRVIVKEDSAVGPIKESKEYLPGQAALPSYPAADRLLTMRGFVRRQTSGISSGTLGRA